MASGAPLVSSQARGVEYGQPHARALVALRARMPFLLQQGRHSYILSTQVYQISGLCESHAAAGCSAVLQ